VLDGLVDPQPFPDWMSEADLAVYVDALSAGVSRSAQPIPRADPRLRRSWRIERTQYCACHRSHSPAEARPRARLHPGVDLLRRPREIACLRFRGSTLSRGPDIGCSRKRKAKPTRRSKRRAEAVARSRLARQVDRLGRAHACQVREKRWGWFRCRHVDLDQTSRCGRGVRCRHGCRVSAALPACGYAPEKRLGRISSVLGIGRVIGPAPARKHIM